MTLTYCTNVHPAETWLETFSKLSHYIPRVKKVFSPNESFPIGLRLSAQAAAEITEAEITLVKDWLLQEDCFIPTINGFPHGQFHNVPVKTDVYLPDWRSPDRVSYTKNLANLLAKWLSHGLVGSISTIPLGFNRFINSADYPDIRRNIRAMLEYLDRIEQETGKQLMLALEPEPGCVIETMENAIEFIYGMNLPDTLAGKLSICYDCCHQAVHFEDPEISIKQLQKSGVKISKVHISSAFRSTKQDPDELMKLHEPIYLHQVVARKLDGDLLYFEDIPEAARACSQEIAEWRIHFHAPVFKDKSGAFGTTRNFIEKALPLLVKENPLMEVETYTWKLFQDKNNPEPLDEAIIKELLWARSVIDEANRST